MKMSNDFVPESDDWDNPFSEIGLDFLRYWHRRAEEKVNQRRKPILMNDFRGMQPTLPPQSTGAADDMDSLPAVQSMDWLFKKERIYLLAQFWQQVSDVWIVYYADFKVKESEENNCLTIWRIIGDNWNF